MKYILCVDVQPQLNPSEDIRKYTIEIEELRKKDDTYDTMVINNEGKIIVTRRIGLRDGETYKLNEEITEELYDINIELFSGINYIYLENITGIAMTLDYVLRNDTEDSYPTSIQMRSAIIQSANEIQIAVSKTLENYSTTTEMNAAITAKANEINLVVATKVGKQEIISSINQTSESIKILAQKIGLEGYTTVNNGFSIDLNGNASIANGAVNINNNGIQMADGTSIVGGNGLMTNLQFSSIGDQYWKTLGIQAPNYDSWKATGLFIDYSIPNNFTVVKAFITIIVKPVYWDNAGRWGYTREIGVFKQDDNPYIILDYNGDFDASYLPMSQLTKIFDNKVNDEWTPTAPTDSSHNIQIKKTDDLDNYYFSPGSTGQFVIKTTNVPSTFDYNTFLRTGAERTAIGDAYLTVLGFMNF